MLNRIRRQVGADAGLGLVLVIGITVFVTTLALAATAIAVHGLAQSRSRVSYEQALAVAETGIDAVLANVQQAYDTENADFAVPSEPTAAQPTPLCNLPAVADNPAARSTEAAEKAWAKSQIQAMLSADPSCLRHAPNGDYAVFKPASTLINGAPRSGRVYSMSWVPGRAVADAKVRLIKSEYVFMPYRPTHAVLTGGDLSISSSTTVRAAYGVDPAEAGVHTNADIHVDGNPIVTGPVTSTDPDGATSTNFMSNPGGTVTFDSRQSIPLISALSLYKQAAGRTDINFNQWYDLCDEGEVRQYAGLLGPCKGTQLNVSASGGKVLPYRGWTWNEPTNTWIATRDALDGIYYAHFANIGVGPGNAVFNNFTVIAEAEDYGDCNQKKYGSIMWDHFDIKAPAYTGMWMYADSDIVTTANFTAGSGISAPPVISGTFIAGDQIHLETSSQGAVGSVTAADQCKSPLSGSMSDPPTNPGAGYVSENEVKNPAIYFDPKAVSPFTSVVDTTLWLEYVG